MKAMMKTILKLEKRIESVETEKRVLRQNMKRECVEIVLQLKWGD